MTFVAIRWLIFLTLSVPAYLLTFAATRGDSDRAAAVAYGLGKGSERLILALLLLGFAGAAIGWATN